MKKAIGYIRVSTEEQSADDKYGIEVQKQAISDYANRNDFEIVCWLTDTISGAKDNRPFYEGKYKYGDMGWVQGVHSPILPLEV